MQWVRFRSFHRWLWCGPKPRVQVKRKNRLAWVDYNLLIFGVGHVQFFDSSVISCSYSVASYDLAPTALRWRWLIIDEISMVSAERELVRDLAQSKYAKDAAYARPFGGLNDILAGDMWQLPPPRGTFLGDVPWEWLMQCKTKKVVHTIRGQELVWGGSPDGIHGVTELVICERTQDIWLRSLQTKYETARHTRRTTHSCMALPRPYLAAGTGRD